MFETQIITTVAVIVAIFVFREVLRRIFRRKLEKLVGYQNLSNYLTAIFTIAIAFYLLNVWGLLKEIVELFLAFGAITAVLLFAVKDVWISNIFAGIALISDKNIKVGTEVEIEGKRGVILEMSLTLTKLRAPNGQLIIVPNQKFREAVVVVALGERAK